jgi:N-methylhydantoinase A
MVQALREVTVERGCDPRDYALVAFGSAAPQHAAHIAEELSIPTVVVPTSPGCVSAFGLLVAQLRHDFVKAYVKPLASIEVVQLDEAVEEFRTRGLTLLRQHATDARVDVSMDLRYAGQAWDLNVPLPLRGSRLTSESIHAAQRDFHSLHQSHYGYHLEAAPLVLVNLRVAVNARQPEFPTLCLPEGAARPPEVACKGMRPAMLDADEGFSDTPVYARSELLANNTVEGPALIEEHQSTTVLPRGWRLVVQPLGHLVLTAA